MSLVLKTNTNFTGPIIDNGFAEYKARVQADGGIISDEGSARLAFILLKHMGLDANNFVSISSVNWGVKIAPHAVVKDDRVVKLYDLFDPSGDIIIVQNEWDNPLAPIPYVYDENLGRYAMHNNEDTSKLTRYDRKETFVKRNNLCMLVNFYNTKVGGTVPSAALSTHRADAANGSGQADRLGYYITFQGENANNKKTTQFLSKKYTGLRSVGNTQYTTGFYVDGSTHYEIKDSVITKIAETDALADNGVEHKLTVAHSMSFNPAAGAIGNYYTIAVAKDINKDQALQLSKVMQTYW